MVLSIALSLLLQAGLPPDQEARRTLHFTPDLPPGIALDLEGAEQIDMELPLAVSDVAEARTRAPSLGEWVVARGICPNEHTKCSLTLRFTAFTGTNRLTKKTEWYARYLARSTDGSRSAEGFCRSLSQTLTDHGYWQRKDGFWILTPEGDDKLREFAFIQGMFAVYREIQQRNQQPALPAPPAKPTTPGTVTVT